MQATTTTIPTTTPAVSLISSDRVEGTEVYAPGGEHIGEIHNLVIDKVSGKVVYAMMSFGGFLGMGKRYYPIPWAALSYDVAQGGYRTNLTEAQVKGAPEYNSDGTLDRLDADWHRRVHSHYGTRPPSYWDGV
ncbi:MAG: PRC-barrel domain-containing protein [Burkholderiaceae bacterium]